MDISQSKPYEKPVADPDKPRGFRAAMTGVRFREFDYNSGDPKKAVTGIEFGLASPGRPGRPDFYPLASTSQLGVDEKGALFARVPGALPDERRLGTRILASIAAAGFKLGETSAADLEGQEFYWVREEEKIPNTTVVKKRPFATKYVGKVDLATYVGDANVPEGTDIRPALAQLLRDTVTKGATPKSGVAAAVQAAFPGNAQAMKMALDASFIARVDGVAIAGDNYVAA